MQHLIDQASKKLTDAKWVPGSYTAARSELWRLVDKKRQTWLTMEFFYEGECGKCFPSELPRAVDLERAVMRVVEED